MALEIGDVIDDKYEVVALLGVGGMGAVYEGRNKRIHRRVAIKVLHGKVANNPDMVRRFQREASAAARIGSRHIVDVLDLGDLADGDHYMVMEFLTGESLTDRCKGQLMAPAVVLPWIAQLLNGLGAAHQAGIIHRDLKPDNVFVTSDGPENSDFVKVLDFGVSKFKTLDEEEGNLTRTGAVMGTPYYMSPEQARGKGAIDHQADLYSVGVIIYKCLTGQHPYVATNMNELMFKIALESPTPIQEHLPTLDPDVIAIIDKAMAQDKEERYASAADFRADIGAWLAQRGISLTSTQTTGRHAAVVTPSLLAADQSTSGSLTPDTLGTPPPSYQGVTPTPKSGSSSRMGMGFGAVALLALLGAGAWVAFGGAPDETSPSQSQATTGATDATTPPPKAPPNIDPSAQPSALPGTSPTAEPSSATADTSPSSAAASTPATAARPPLVGGGKWPPRPAPAVTAKPTVTATPTAAPTTTSTGREHTRDI